MMPLGFATTGEDNVIRRVGGNPEMKKHLEDMGFVTGGI
ncbi:MAG: FeoA domain-containing protein, partial [Oscillospiraceae bacterium]|nr:FeoA domain-containing protein [Oscillospiraceae bacterium]